MKVIGVQVGAVGPLPGRAGAVSAIAKRAVHGSVAVGPEGLAGDAQADRRIHGGPDKAVHLYAARHYPDWRAALGKLPKLDSPGAFGENLTLDGADETTVCFGDRVRVGSVLMEVSQSRQPCWKLNAHFGVPDMARRFQDTGRTGWYCRVLEPGLLQAGDHIELVERPWPDWPLSLLIEMLYRRRLDRDLLARAQRLPLVPSWRRLIEQRLESGRCEDWRARLEGQA